MFISSGVEVWFWGRSCSSTQDRKSRREELFGRDVELNLLHDNVNSPIIVIAGIRRIGKTSLLNVFLNEVKHSKYYCRFEGFT
jgi:predicted AAA+ superfamily ATPase